jgi:integrase
MTPQFSEPKIFPLDPQPADMHRNWYVWFRYLNPATKKREQLRFKKDINQYKVFKERLLAAEALQEVLLEKLRNNWNPFAPEIEVKKIDSIETAINFILAIKKQTLRKKSNDTYQYICKLFKEWLQNKNMLDDPLRAFTAVMAHEYMDYLLMKKKYAGRTFNDHLIVLRTFFNCFIEKEWIVKNPFRAVKRKTQTVGRNQAYNGDEKNQLEEYFKKNDIRMYYLSQFIFHGFIRRTELSFLRVKHIDVHNGTIIIPGENAKNNNQESVVIPVGLEPVIQQMKLYQFDQDDYVFGRGLKTGPIRFSNPNHISSRHNKVVEKLGISNNKGLYSWKHTGVCHYYYATGKDIYSIMRQLRHRDLTTTMIYLKSLGLVNNDAFRNARVA